MEVAGRRRAEFDRLSRLFRTRCERTLEQTAEAARHISDLQFTETYRVPFQFSRLVKAHLPMGSFLASSDGVMVTDLDGNACYDLSGSYGVNLLGYDFYKACLDRGAERVSALGPVLGSYPSLVADNVARLARISGKDEVSFHMSGTEAVMQAVRLARYHTRRSHLVRLCGAYHGWWGDVQPGVGNPVPAHETYTLAEMSEASLEVLRRRSDIACVLVNPSQALYPNHGAPADSTLIHSRQNASVDRAAYAEWLKQLRAVCSERGIVLIFDEVFVGFRLALGGAQEYFGVDADLVTYGKTVGGGLPVGVVCGHHRYMKRFRDDRPADVCFARGTFNSHPYVMGAMNEFLRHLDGRRCARSIAISTPPGRGAPRRSTTGLARWDCPFRWLTCRRSGRSATRSPRATTGCSSITSGRRPGLELDRHRPADLQPELHGRRLRRRGTNASSPPQKRCAAAAGGRSAPSAPTAPSSDGSCARCLPTTPPRGCPGADRPTLSAPAP